MSDKPIGPGDVVQVVRGHPRDFGKVGTVAEVGEWSMWECMECGHREYGLVAAAVVERNATGSYGFPLSWLKRFDPPANVQEEQHQEEIAA